MTLDPAVVLLAARVLLVLMFPFSALDKVLHWGDAVKQANSSFLPGGPVLVVLAMALEVAGPVCVVSGWHPQVAALALAGFCALTAPLQPCCTTGSGTREISGSAGPASTATTSGISPRILVWPAVCCWSRRAQDFYESACSTRAGHCLLAPLD